MRIPLNARITTIEGALDEVQTNAEARLIHSVDRSWLRAAKRAYRVASSFQGAAVWANQMGGYVPNSYRYARKARTTHVTLTPQGDLEVCRRAAETRPFGVGATSMVVVDIRNVAPTMKAGIFAALGLEVPRAAEKRKEIRLYSA